MDKYYERQTDLMCYLNDNMVEETELIADISDIFEIQFIDDGVKHGWYITEQHDQNQPTN